MSLTKHCTHIPLGHNAVGEVMFCTDCGVVSVTLQCMTVRLEADAFAELAALLGAAKNRLAHLAASHVEDLHPGLPQRERHMH